MQGKVSISLQKAILVYLVGGKGRVSWYEFDQRFPVLFGFDLPAGHVLQVLRANDLLHHLNPNDGQMKAFGVTAAGQAYVADEVQRATRSLAVMSAQLEALGMEKIHVAIPFLTCWMGAYRFKIEIEFRERGDWVTLDMPIEVRKTFGNLSFSASELEAKPHMLGDLLQGCIDQLTEPNSSILPLP
jgi:hypothetical protein